MKKPFDQPCFFGLSPFRRVAHPVCWIALVCVAMALLPAWAARGQDVSQTAPPYMGPNSRTPSAFSRYDAQPRFSGDDYSYMESVRIAQFKVARAKALVKDTDKLLKLATELNDEMGGNKAEPPGEGQLRKVSKIAKLAHKVEENMKLVIIPRRRSPFIFPNPFPSRPPNHP